MNSEPKNDGFSLTEVLLAVGILAVGLIFIAGVFPVAIHFTTIATERTVAAVAADEAFAKIRLYGFNPLWWPVSSTIDCNDFREVSSVFIDPNEFAYPSTYPDITQKRYYWSALCRRVSPDPNSRLVQVTVFISRKVGASGRYWDRDSSGGLIDIAAYPIPIFVEVSQVGPDELSITDNLPGDGIDEESFINDGYTIVDNETGRIYRVLERYSDNDRIILLDRPWEPGLVFINSGFAGPVWVVPPPVNGGRYPCIGVYQKVIRF